MVTCNLIGQYWLFFLFLLDCTSPFVPIVILDGVILLHPPHPPHPSSHTLVACNYFHLLDLLC